MDRPAERLQEQPGEEERDHEQEPPARIVLHRDTRPEEERAEGERRVSLLRSDRVDPDMLDERARYQLDYANPRDLVRTARPN